MKRTTSLFVAAALALSVYALSALSDSHEHKAHADHSGHAEHAAEDHADMMMDDAKARCAFDGMLMKTSAMKGLEVDGETLYFCSDKQAEMFLAAPDKHLKRIALGDMSLRLSLLTVSEYKTMMNEMGMGSSVDDEAMNGKSHMVAAYAVRDGADAPLEDAKLALRIVGADDKPMIVPLAYNKMMKTHNAAISIADGAKSVAVIVTTAPVSL